VSDHFIVRAPDSLGDKGLVGFFRGWTWHDDPPARVTLDFSTADFVAPWSAAMFRTYGRWLQDARGKSVDAWLNEATSAGQFLIRSTAAVAGLAWRFRKLWPGDSGNSG